MEFTYCYSASMTIFFDDAFKVECGNCSLGTAIEMIETYCETYKFKSAVVFDDDTGCILVTAQRKTVA